MKTELRKIVLSILRFFARQRLKKLHPKIVGVTGSVGKTSAKDAIADVLSRRFSVKKNEQSLNSEFGTVLTILEQKSGYSSVGAWISIILKCAIDSVKKLVPYDILVMEMGVDKPGDMSEILEIVSPEIMVFMNVKNVHRSEGQFSNRQAIFDEKSKAVYAVGREGWTVLNIDDNFVKQLVGNVQSNVVTIGLDEEADLRALDVKSGIHGLKFTLAYEDKELHVHLPHVLGECHVHIALAAIAVGFINGMPWKAIDMALREFSLPPGRMNLIDGASGCTIIDSSYNASPDTMEAALHVLENFSGRKIAALGTMNELGELSESAHLKIGKLVSETADMLIAVGEQAKNLAEGAQRGGMSASLIHTFKNSRDAGKFLNEILGKHDVVLVKGSQNEVRMEHLVKIIMKEPEQARHLLVRQEPYWLTHL